MCSPSRGVVPLQTEAAGAAPPDAFGPFHVLYQVGAGALGQVFRAFDPQGDRLVAIKVFRLGLPPDRMHQLVSAMERLIAVDLRHPVIVAPIAAGTDGIIVYVAQPFVAADSLDIVMRDRGPLSPSAALGIAAQLAGALDFAAVVDVYHGALHPRDVLVADDEVRLTGLGVARVLERLGVAPPVRRPYSAPERVAGAPWDRRADIFGLAAMTHEMLWGRRVAGPGDEAARSLTDIAGGDLPRLRGAFAKALVDHPPDRFDTALDFVVALKSAFPDVAIAPVAPAQDRKPSAVAAVPGRDDRLPFEVDSRSGDGSVAVDPEPVASEAADSESTAAFDHPADEGTDHPVSESVLGQPSSVADPPSSADASLASSGDLQPAASPPTSINDDLSLRVDTPSAADVDVPLRQAAVDPRAASVPKVSDDLWQGKVSQPSLKWIERETTPVVYEEPALFRSAEGEGATSRPLWPIGLAIVAGLVVGFASGYLVGSQRAAASTAAAAPTPVAPPISESRPAPSSQPASVVQPEAPAQGSPRPSLPTPTPVASESATKAAAKPAAKESAAAKVAPVKAAPIADARLVVNSVPAGALVTVDGVERGRTPATIRDLVPGTHRLRVARDGYATDNRRVAVARSSKPTTIRVTLRKIAPEPAGRATGAAAQRAGDNAASAQGEIEIQSRPEGAQVFLDGKLVGTTPIAKQTATAGEHALRLEHDGYRRWTSSVRVVGGQRTRVTASLER